MNKDQDSIQYGLVPDVRIDEQGLLNGDANVDSMDGNGIDVSHGHIERSQEDERKTAEQEYVVENSLPEQKVRSFVNF